MTWGSHQAERNTQLSALVPYFLDFVIHLQLQVNVSGVLTRSKMYLNPAHIYTSRASVSNPPILLAKTFAILNYQIWFFFNLQISQKMNLLPQILLSQIAVCIVEIVNFPYG